MSSTAAPPTRASSPGPGRAGQPGGRPGRAAAPVPPRDRHRADHPGHAGRRGPGDDQGPRAEPLRRREHALQRRGCVGAVGPQDAVLLHARLARDLARRLEGRHHPSHAQRLERLQRRHLGAVPHRHRPRRAARPGGRAPGASSASWSTCGSPRPATTAAFPLDDRSALEIIITPRPQLASPRDRYIYFPDTAEVPEAQAVNVRNRSFTIGALVDIPAPGAQGVLFAHGSRFGGHALYVKDNRLHYVNNFVGMIEQKIDGDRGRPDRGEPDPVRLLRQGRRGPARRCHRDPVAVPRGQEGRRRPDQDPARTVHRSRARACASAATAASR